MTSDYDCPVCGGYLEVFQPPWMDHPVLICFRCNTESSEPVPENVVPLPRNVVSIARKRPGNRPLSLGR